jgi:hypothetical protein
MKTHSSELLDSTGDELLSLAAARLNQMGD